MPSRVGVCSWSLHPDSPRELVERVLACGLHAVQLALDPIRTGRWSEIETRNRLAAAADHTDGSGIAILSGMMATRGEDYSTLDSIKVTGGLRPDQHWADNLAAAKANARLARRLGLSLVTFHAGFIPHEPGHPREVIISRLRQVVDVFDDHGVRIGLETGQESAQTLLEALHELDRPHTGVNFDPANMILYGMGDPIEALTLLAGRVVQVHIKDARPSPRAGEWGTETPAGSGAVDWDAFFRVLRASVGGAAAASAPLPVDCLIERESGERRVDDIRAAHGLVARRR